MKRTIYTFLLAVCLPAVLYAQAYEGTTDYNKKKHSAFIAGYPYSPEAVENAIIAKMEKLGYKGKEEKGIFNGDKGFRKFKGAYISEVSDNSHDYIIKVERKSKKEDDKSIVYMIMIKDDLNAMSQMDAGSITKAKSFLNNLLPNIEASHLELQIKAQEEVVAKAEKKLRNLQTDKEDMEKKVKKLQDDIVTNGKDQENTTKDIEAQRASLEALKQRRVL